MTSEQVILQAIEALAKEVRELRALLGAGESHVMDPKGYFNIVPEEVKTTTEQEFKRLMEDPETKKDAIAWRKERKALRSQPSPYSE